MKYLRTRPQSRALALLITEAIFISYIQINHRGPVTEGAAHKVKVGGGGGVPKELDAS